MTRSAKENDCTVAGEKFGAIHLRSVLSTVHKVWENIAVPPLTTELPWTLHRFYSSSFSMEFGMRRKREQAE